MASKDRQIPILVGESYCILCGKDVTCYKAKYGADDSHRRHQDSIHLDYHSKVVVLDANINEGRGPGHWRTLSMPSRSSRTSVPSGRFWPSHAESPSGASALLKPYAPYFKRRYFAGEPSYYDIYLPKDLVYSQDGSDYIGPDYKKVNFKKGQKHHAAGGYVGRARVATLGTLFKNAHILYRDEQGEWRLGQVGEFEGYKSVRRRIEQASRKRRQKYRAYMKRATIWDHIENAD